MYVSSGDEVCREFFGEPNSGPHELNRRCKTGSFVAASFLNEATVDSVLLYLQYSSLRTKLPIGCKLLRCMEQCEDSGTTQKKDEDTRQNATINSK